MTAADDYKLRWALTSSWARGQSFGPWAHGAEPEEAERIEAIRDLIVKYDPNDELSDQEILDLAVADLASDSGAA
jgi:hypothetical protein